MPHGLDERARRGTRAGRRTGSGLARWLFDRRQPLTARVFVNRVWQMHFGRGIVETSEDFGSQGAIPTHPELLDWLAVEFIESGWDVKALHRLHRDVGDLPAELRRVAPELLTRDAANALYARGPRWRMTAEMVRDSALAASGLLAAEVGGPSVKPYQPAGIWNPLNSFYTYPDARDAARRRAAPPHALHVREAQRDAPRHEDLRLHEPHGEHRAPPQLEHAAAGAAAHERPAVRRSVSLARRARRCESSADEDAQLARLYRLATRATPSAEHLAVLRDYYTRAACRVRRQRREDRERARRRRRAAPTRRSTARRSRR